MIRINRAAAIAAVALLAATLGASAQTNSTTRPQNRSRSGATRATQPHAMAAKGESCQQLMTERQDWTNQMRQMDERLDQMVSRMNAATGDQKIQDMSAVIAELVSQRRTMLEHMQTMQDHVMVHMAEHMQNGGTASAMSCPARKEMMQGESSGYRTGSTSSGTAGTPSGSSMSNQPGAENGQRSSGTAGSTSSGTNSTNTTTSGNTAGDDSGDSSLDKEHSGTKDHPMNPDTQRPR